MPVIVSANTKKAHRYRKQRRGRWERPKISPVPVLAILQTSTQSQAGIIAGVIIGKQKRDFSRA
jgi:hypothetical protein